ncbi:hypothetical protein [Desulfosporosinus youngiae]|uniref:Major tropism determinant N-terminal domain-containing protein n=1 Tax=Desulfosporosinus youngiae DSM 17734 TaxID=768710 RepID=H5Y2N8_9FIRM|nr:hypothetical protein [Desulfosporosinus youngiae]EHQ88301.1 hypothetical protein DesyoDRAFT_1131 [Desulfosporosinus youngiae DSM 17734]
MPRKVLIQIRRGLEGSIGSLAVGELGFCTDTKKLYIGTDSGNELLVAAQTVGDMLKSIYDTNNDGKVDLSEDADTVDGKHASDLYVLTLAVPFNNGDNLDDFITPGCWYSSNAAKSATLSNCPSVSSGGKLIVEHIGSASNSTRQKWIVNSQSAIVYERQRTSIGWGSWQKIANQSDIAAQVSKSGDTMTGKLTLPASTADSASLNIPQGVGPSSLVNGDILTLSDGVYVTRGGTRYMMRDAGNTPAVSQAEAEAGTVTQQRVWSPQRVAQAIAAQALSKGPITWNQLKGV